MKRMKFLGMLIAFGLIGLSVRGQNNVETDFNTAMMKNTYMIEGNGSIGTAFLSGISNKQDTKFFNILITARHVLDGIKGDSATLYYRIMQNDKFIKVPYRFAIRRKGVNLYVSNPTEDVAVMYFEYLIQMHTLPLKYFATDSMMKAIDIHPGDDVSILGYPFGLESNDAGFPILRKGMIASFPILPAKEYKTFLVDFQVFSGNSGGPVYFVQNGARGHNYTLDFQRHQFIMGLVIQEEIFHEHIKTMDEEKIIDHKLFVSKVIQAVYILETINLLPNID